MSSVDGGNATLADRPVEKQKALCVATRCTSAEQFVATFHRFCDETSFFVATLATRPVGLETAFSIQLEDKTPVLRGLCVVVEAWSTPANRFGRPGVRLDVRRLTNDSIAVFKQLQQARIAAEAAQPATAPQKAMHDPAAAQAAFDAAANAAMDLVASETAAAAKESKAALEAAAKRAMTEAEAAAPAPTPAAAPKLEPPPLLPKGTRDGLAPINHKATQAIGALLKTPATPATGKPIVANAFPALPTTDSDTPAVGAKPTKQMPPMPVTKFATPSQPIPRLKDGATPPAGSPTAPPPLPSAMRITPPTAIPVVRAVPDVAKIESVKLRAEGTAPVAKETIAKDERHTTEVDTESFDEKTVDIQNKLTAAAVPTKLVAKSTYELGPIAKSALESGPVARVTVDTGPVPTISGAKSAYELGPIAKSALESGPVARVTVDTGPIAKIESGPIAATPVVNPGAPKATRPEETRTPGSSFVLPANPLMNLTDASLEGFIDCALYEETGNFYRAEDTGLVDVGDLIQPPLPNQLSPIQALRPGDVTDRQPSYIGPMPNQHSYMGQLPTANTQPLPTTGYAAPPQMRGGSTQPMPHGQNDVNVSFSNQSPHGLSPTAFNARRAQSEMFSPEQTPIPMLLGPSYTQQLEDAARDHAATTPPPFGPPETRTNWARAETPDPSRSTPNFARVEVNRIDTQPQFGRPDTTTQQVEMDMQRSTGQTPPQGRDYTTGAFIPQRGGRFATGQFPPQPMSTAAPDAAPGAHPLVGPGAIANVDANGYPVAPAFAQPGYPSADYLQPNNYPPPQYAQHNPAMHAASLPSTPLTPRPRRERTQMTASPRRLIVIAGSAAVATAAIIAIVLLATRGEHSATTTPTTKLATSNTHPIDTNVAKPAPKNEAAAAVVKTPTETKAPVETKVETKAPAIATRNDATVARPETTVVAPKVEEPKAADPDETPSESDAPVVVGTGPCRMEIASTPAGSIVKVDDQTVGPSPVTVAGACKRTKIEINHARYAATTKWVVPTEGTPANVDVQLSRPTHAVTVTSSPAGATVSIGGRRAGTTPTSVSLMGFSTLTLTFEKKGYGTVTEKFYSKKDNDHVSVTLKKGK
ncbi:MAG TPA: PEGA domain-containing protein [Kofleriaceae bacterium]|jgi:hypothetical protein